MLSEMLGEEKAKPLESRMNIVTLDNLTNQQKLNIANEHIAQRCAKEGIDLSMIDPTMIAAIIQEDTAADYKGVRVMLQVVDEYIRMLEHSDLIKSIANISELTFDPKKEYRSRSKKL